MMMISRRKFVQISAGLLSGPTVLGCVPSPTSGDDQAPRLSARPGAPSLEPTRGLTSLGLGNGRDGVLFVPDSYDPTRPAPLFIALHGAGGEGRNWSSYPERAETRNLVVLAPDSRSTTWDVLRGGFGPDVAFIDRALRHTFERCHIDPTHIALGGFSDGASYALSLGRSNGDLFTHMVGFSPGFMVQDDPPVGMPLVFISHGTRDSILPVRLSRDNIVPSLRKAGYDVTYHEFDGEHTVPGEISDEALDWFLAPPGRPYNRRIRGVTPSATSGPLRVLSHVPASPAV